MLLLCVYLLEISVYVSHVLSYIVEKNCFRQLYNLRLTSEGLLVIFDHSFGFFFRSH